MIAKASNLQTGAARRESYWRWGLVVAGLLGLSIAWIVLPVQEWLQAFNAWVEQLGLLGYLLFGLIYIAGTVALAPGGVLTIAGGLAFGLWAFPLVVVSATIGATLAFLIARHIARDRVKTAIADRPNFKAVERAVDQEGWKVVALLRLSPIFPFNLQNYAFGVTSIPLAHYVAATFVGIMPGALLYTYLGAAGRVAGGGPEGGALKWTFFGIGLLVTVAVTVWITIRARKMLGHSGVAKAGDA